MKRLYGIFLVVVGVYFLYGGTVKPRAVPIEKPADGRAVGPAGAGRVPTGARWR